LSIANNIAFISELSFVLSFDIQYCSQQVEIQPFLKLDLYSELHTDLRKRICLSNTY